MRDGTGQEFQTVVIGGGQAGLATGYHLAKRGLPFVILDANERVGDSWRKRWDSLRVFTPARYDSLPGWPFPAPSRSFPTKDEIADYLEEYAARFELPVRNGVRVERMAREGSRFVVMAGDRRFEADNVVVATGGYQSPRVPESAHLLDPGILQLHSTEYRHPSQLREGPVLVVGASNSGAEIALEVARDHPTWLSGRDTGHEPTQPGTVPDRLLVPVIWFMFSHVITRRTPLGRAVYPKLRDHGLPLARVRNTHIAAAGIERVPRVADVRDGLPVLEDGRVLDAANVIWCTGFASDFGWIDLPIFDQDGRPLHDRGVVGSEPGLYFVGLFFLHSVASALIGGAGPDAAHVVSAIVSRPRDAADTNGAMSAATPTR
jgi:putative flavoprotein involved in K+ transport